MVPPSPTAPTSTISCRCPHGTLGARGGGLDLRADRAALPSQDAHLILSQRSLTPPPASDMEGDAAARPAMTEVLFYHLEHQPLERVLPALVERTLERKWRAVIQVGSEERLEALDTLLWTYRV